MFVLDNYVYVGNGTFSEIGSSRYAPYIQHVSENVSSRVGSDPAKNFCLGFTWHLGGAVSLGKSFVRMRRSVQVGHQRSVYLAQRSAKPPLGY